MKAAVSFLKSAASRFVLLILAVTLTGFPLQGLIASRVSAAETGTWVSGDMPQLVMGAAVQPSGVLECTPTSFVYLSYTKADGSFDSIGRFLRKDVCATSNDSGSYGATSGGYDYVQPKTSTAFAVLDGSGRRRSVEPIPNQPSFVYAHIDNLNPWGNPIHIYDSFASAGVFEPHYGSVNEMAFKINAPSDPIRDSNNNAIQFRNRAFSSNGEWMFAEALGIGLIRMHIPTRQMQLISTERYTYDVGLTPAVTFAISDDGKSAIRSSINVNIHIAYDLSGCQPAAIVPSSGSATLAPGCKSRDVRSSLTQQVSGFVGFLRMRFTHDGKSVIATVAKTTPEGRRYFAATYSVAGYQAPHP